MADDKDREAALREEAERALRESLSVARTWLDAALRALVEADALAEKIRTSSCERLDTVRSVARKTTEAARLARLAEVAIEAAAKAGEPTDEMRDTAKRRAK